MKKANANLMKEINLNIVRQTMKGVEIATKPQLASWTKLSVVTINSLVRELCELGEILEDQTAPSSGGRPALTYRYNFDFSHALVIYMREKQGQELISFVVVNLDNQILFKEELLMSVFDREQFYESIGGIVADDPAIKVIGIGIPGQVVGGEITVSGHLELRGFPLIHEIESHFGLPVMVENDINAALRGYCAKNGLDLEDEVCVGGMYFPETYPPGMAIYMDGKIFKGKNGMAGEISFLPALGLDWHGQIEELKFMETLCGIIQAVSVILAPDRIVVYQDRMAEEAQWYPLWETYQLQYPVPSYPEIIFQETFQQDFEAGMRWLTLKELEPARQIHQ
ncbi:ROK family protein [Paenibacillus senegalimassiliensis]|uniref:ROK family protein n=1 Tax=Paenibacillus senegalimassiliensis TaxID=1737426 RepID=UPI00073F1FA9|nr:ROK family protein [Paenibacillus senegalimassiliensis]